MLGDGAPQGLGLIGRRPKIKEKSGVEPIHC
jgi:hypothetical protein